MSTSPTEGVFTEAWALYRAHWPHLAQIALIVYVVVTVLTVFTSRLPTPIGPLLGLAISVVALYWLQAALIRAVDDIRSGRTDLSVGRTFASVRSSLPTVLAASVIAGIAILLGFILLILPGLVVLTLFAMIVPAIVLEDRGVGASFARSVELVRAEPLRTFGVILMLFLILIAFSIALSLVLDPLDEGVQVFVRSVVAGVLTTPFAALVLTILYFRLRAVPRTT